MTYQPYTYLIRFKPTGQLYYGSKTAKNCSPDDLWVKYFTSSKVVKKLIADFGRDSFEIVSIKLHETKEDAMKWEEMYLVSVDGGYNPEYLNKTNGGQNFTTAGMHFSEESKELNRIAHLGNIHSEEWKIEHSKKMTGEGNSQFGKRFFNEDNPNYGNVGELNPLSKKYIITFPDGHEEIIIGLKHFCEKYNLINTTMVAVARNKPSRIQHKGFKCRYYIEPFIEPPIE